MHINICMITEFQNFVQQEMMSTANSTLVRKISRDNGFRKEIWYKKSVVVNRLYIVYLSETFLPKAKEWEFNILEFQRLTCMSCIEKYPETYIAHSISILLHL